MPYNYSTGIGKVRDYAQSKGRTLNADQWNQIGQGWDPNRTDYTDADLQTAYGRVDAMPWGPVGTPANVHPITKTKSGPTQVVTGQPVNIGPDSISPGTQWSPAPTPGPGPATQDTVNSGVWAKLNELLNRKPTYDPNAPENKMRMDVARVGNQRSAERRRASAAERLAQQGFASGGSGGPLDTEVDKILADQGMADTSFEAELAKDSIDRDRSEAMQALGIGAGLTGQSMDAGSRMQLAQLDAALRREGMSLQSLLGKGQLGNQLLALLLNSQLGNDRLGFDYADLIARMNQGAFNFGGGR